MPCDMYVLDENLFEQRAHIECSSRAVNEWSELRYCFGRAVITMVFSRQLKASSWDETLAPIIQGRRKPESVQISYKNFWFSINYLKYNVRLVRLLACATSSPVKA